MRLAPIVFTLLLIPIATALSITEIHPAPTDLEEYVEIWVDEPNGTLVIEDNYETDMVDLTLNHTGPVLIVEDASVFTGLECPIIELSSRIGNGLANGGDTVTVTLGNMSGSHTYTDAASGMSLSRCAECDAFVEEAPSPCIAFETPPEQEDNAADPADANNGNASDEPSDTNEVECIAPKIEAEPIQEDRISYRVRSSEAYEYWIEDAFGEVVRERASSETDSTKRYTPDPTAREHLFRIHATSTCGRAELVVGFISQETPECELTEDQVLEAVTEQLATYICRPHIEQAAMLEAELDACEHPEPAMTSFYTRSRSSNETYTYRSKAKTNATYLACAASDVARSDEDLAVVFEDRDLTNATPMLIALENGTVIDVRVGDVPGFVGGWIDPDDTDEGEEDETGSDEESEESGVGIDEPEDSGEEDEAPEESVIEPPRRDDPGSVRRAMWWIINSIRTNRGVQSSSEWIVPVSFGIAGLTLALPRT